VAPDHFGAIPGVDVGMCWKTRLQVSEEGVHRPHVAGIAGKSAVGCPSVVLSGGYPYDEDRGEEFVYTGCSGRDLSGNKRVAKGQSFDQCLIRQNLAIARSCAAPIDEKNGSTAKDWREGKPIRVVRTDKLRKVSQFAPKEGCRYDGLYRVVRYWPEQREGFRVWRYLFRRDDPQPAPWTEEGKHLIMANGYDKVIHREDGNGNGKDKSLRVIEVDKKIKQVANSVEGREGERLRQLLETPFPSKHTLVTAVEEAFKCPICQLAAARPACGPCGHVICSGDCLKGLILATEIADGGFSCALCRAQVKPGECKKNNMLKTTLRLLMPGYDLSRQ